MFLPCAHNTKKQCVYGCACVRRGQEEVSARAKEIMDEFKS